QGAVCQTVSTGDPQGEKTGEEEEDKGPSSQPVALRNCFHLQRNSILEKLIKTCPVWLQFGISLEKIFMVQKDETLKNLFLLVHFPAQKEGCDILEYKIKEEKSCKCWCNSDSGQIPELHPVKSKSLKLPPRVTISNHFSVHQSDDSLLHLQASSLFPWERMPSRHNIPPLSL
uniref:Uncharacterized protein n=1 Tax=Naja naja TaxID=35670 RepID=A0A8C6X1M0_NAJNA